MLCFKPLMTQKHILLKTGFLLFFFGFIYSANAAVSHVYLTTRGGPMSLSVGTSSYAFSPQKSSASEVETTARLNVYPRDARGTAIGWSVFANVTNSGIAGASARKRKISGAGSAGPDDFSITGFYDGSRPQAAYGNGAGGAPSGEIIMLIENVDSNGAPSLVKFMYPDGSSAAARTVSNGAVEFAGLIFNFGGRRNVFAANNLFGIQVDHQSYTKLKTSISDLKKTDSQEPSAVPAGDVLINDEAFFAGESIVSNAMPRMEAQYGRGMGYFEFRDNLTWTLHPNSMSGEYRANIIYTIL